MTKAELSEILDDIQRNKCETQILEIKAAESGCPRKMYDTLSSFSNQDDGGVIVFPGMRGIRSARHSETDFGPMSANGAGSQAAVNGGAKERETLCFC